MAGLSCPMCNQVSIETKVKLIYKNQTVDVFESALKCINHASEKKFLPCIIQHVYTCQKCGYEDIKLESYYDER